LYISSCFRVYIQGEFRLTNHQNELRRLSRFLVNQSRLTQTIMRNDALPDPVTLFFCALGREGLYFSILPFPAWFSEDALLSTRLSCISLIALLYVIQGVITSYSGFVVSDAKTGSTQ
jgi:hypothetical protein